MCGGKVAIPPIVKEKRRNSEKRKEKSRDAARCRRSKESEIFSDLSSQLPLPQGIASTLDKASIMRLTVSYLKVRDVMEILTPSGKDLTSPVDSTYDTAVLNGFLLVLSEEGDIIYLSEDVEDLIGLSQVEMMGHSVYDFSHPYDHEEIKSVLASTTASKPNEKSNDEKISFFVRMKSTLKSKGRTVNLKSSTYQVIHYIGHKYDNPGNLKNSKCPTFYLIFIGNTIPHPAQIDVPLDKDIFISRHSPDMKFTHVDERVAEFLGYKSSELLGKSVYSYHHALDASALASAYQTLFSKGQCETGYYRFLSKYGGYVWVVTQATLIYDNGTKPECVVCLNYVLSNVENKNEIISAQQELTEKPEPAAPLVEEVEQPLAKHPVLLSSTSTVFAPKETVMSKDFLNFPDTDILLFQEPLKDSKLNLDLDLFPDDPCAIGSNICDDPFISYRDDSLSSPSYGGTSESSLNLHSSSSTSPNHFSTTPSTPDSGSLSDIPSLDPIDEFSNLDLKFTMPPSLSDKDSDCYEEDLDFRAPFISMNMDDDFPLISPSSSVMWGPQEPAPKKTERLPDPEPQRISPPRQKSLTEANMKSSLAALLQSDLNKKPHAKEKNVISRKDNSLHKRWQNSSLDNNRNNIKQRNFTPSRSYGNSGGGGHIIMLDSIPVKKQPGKASASQKRSGQTASNDRRSNSPPFGSHTATVKVNDRLIKVQVSVSELTTAPIEHKQPFPSPPDPPPKRTSPSRPGPTESPKRLKVDSGLSCSAPQGIVTDSVLLNLLISGEDASRGYLCSSSSRYSENKYESAAVPSLSSSNSSSKSTTVSSSNCTTELLPFWDSIFKISQYDAEMNAPIQSSHLLEGDDLLNALDNQPQLRNVPALV